MERGVFDEKERLIGCIHSWKKAGGHVIDLQPPSSALNCNDLSHNFRFSVFAG
jgi:hypothetical protein